MKIIKAALNSYSFWIVLLVSNLVYWFAYIQHEDFLRAWFQLIGVACSIYVICKLRAGYRIP